jgi:hypothetical protein
LCFFILCSGWVGCVGYLWCVVCGAGVRGVGGGGGEAPLAV